MDKDKFNKEINKIFQNKKFVNCLICFISYYISMVGSK